MGSVSSFWCHICACKFMIAYIYQAILRVGGVGDYLKYSPVAAKILLLCRENGSKDLKKQYSLKMYVTTKYQFILHDKNIVRILPAINHPSHVSSTTRREGCPRTKLTIACCSGCYMSRWFFQPLRGCECFSQNLH